MISAAALDEFKAIWRSQFAEDIPDEVAMDEATNLLTMFDAVYRPLKQSDIDEYEKLYKQL
ncbi:MAG TPA: hypothetical protein VJI70_00660 [Candidatus Paceibacterota bacterium]